MIKKITISLMLIVLTGCMPSEGKKLVRDQHAVSKVMSDRVNNPNRQPSVEEMKEVINSEAKAWESMDRMVNHWKP